MRIKLIDDLINNLKKAYLFTQERYVKLNDLFREDEWQQAWASIEATIKYLENLKGQKNES